MNDCIGNVQYYLGFNLYDSRTKITKYDNEVGLLGKDSDGNLIYRKGMELGEIWGILQTAYILPKILTVKES